MKLIKGAGGSWRLEIHAELASTSDHLIRLASTVDSGGGEADCLAVMALRQTKGRGQFGRVWQAPEGNLNLSMLLRPNTVLSESPQWSLAAGVAAAEALQSFVPDVRLKYPNDLILDGAKLGGILVDSAAGENRLAWLVIGIGINIETAPDVAEQQTVALADRGICTAPQDLAIRLLERVAAWRYIIECDGFAAVRRAWFGWALDPEGARAHLQQWEGG